MPKYYLRFLFVLLPFSAFAYSPEDVSLFTENYAYIAVKQMMEYDIPASIILAQAFLESKHGQSALAQDSNNFFGIKAKKDWQGPYVVMKSAEYKRHKRHVKRSRFRKYDFPEESWRDHSEFLANGNRYRRLFEQGLFNYKGWARGLQKAGYATDPKYAKKLIGLIERHHFNDFDKVAFQLSHHIPVRLDAMHPENHIAILRVRGAFEDVSENIAAKKMLEKDQAMEKEIAKKIEFEQTKEPTKNKFYIYLSEDPKPIIRRVESSNLYKMKIRS